MSDMQVTFIGGGNMASAIIGGYVTTGASPQAIHVVDPNDQVLDRLSRDWGITPHHALDEHALAVDVVVLAVKPQVMPEVLATLATRMPAAHAAHGPVVVSVAGGITLDTMANALGERAMIRCMPNTPALVGAGITALVANAHTTAEHRRLASHLLEQVGTCVWLDDEPLLDLVTAVSGSGPAYFFALAEHMVAAAVARGMDDKLARALVHQTAAGAGQMLTQAGVAAATLRENVTSPGGTTEAALNAFDAAKLDAAVDQAIDAAWRRAQALAEDVGQAAQPSPGHRQQET
ncbi:MAG: pyrroline-5-carboxylate reductase [Wenzhouxiangella sp.]|nr:pyrroline-5-carboxylate reductase [Wenzhouxiangella sp.]